MAKIPISLPTAVSESREYSIAGSNLFFCRFFKKKTPPLFSTAAALSTYALSITHSRTPEIKTKSLGVGQRHHKGKLAVDAGEVGKRKF